MSLDLKVLALLPNDQWRTTTRLAAAEDNASWYVFSASDAELHPDLASILHTHGAERPTVDIFYGDEVIASGPDRPLQYLCKPSFDATQLIAQDYVGLPVAVRHRAMAALGELDASAGSAQVYDMLLRATSAGIEIGRITEVLAVNRPGAARATTTDRLAVLKRALLNGRAADCDVVPGLTGATVELRRRFDNPPDVTLVIPTRQSVSARKDASRNNVPMVLSMLESLGHTKWPMDRLHVLVGDDQEDGIVYEGRSWPFDLRRVVTTRAPGEPFNYASKMNRLWRAAETEYLVIMNDDLLIRDAGWLQALMTFAVDDGVGGVGARLLYPNGTIQHVGMPGGVLGPCTHAFINMPATAPTYQNWAIVQREWSIVTGAVFATRRSLLEQVNGFDERFPLDYNDVDLCLRLRLLGFRIVYTPYAELTHLESASRGRPGAPPDETALFLEKWQHFLNNDPAYHPRLTRSTSLIEPMLSDKDWWIHFREASG